jgi:hypothetical protein
MGDYKNILVQYRGGGYDGCFWEWNYFTYDNEGVFHNIATSGYAGIKAEEEALEKIKGSEVEDDIFVYDLTDATEIDRFQRRTAPIHVKGVVDMVNSGRHGSYDTPDGEGMWWKCDDCGEKVFDGGQMEGFHGDGGIGVVAEEKYCDDCYSAGCCYECGEYAGKEEIIEHGGMCEWCEEKQTKELLKNITSTEGLVCLSYRKWANDFEESDGDTVLSGDWEDEDDGYVYVVCMSNDADFVLRCFTEQEAINAVKDHLAKSGKGIASCKVENLGTSNHHALAKLREMLVV